ncbi:MAG: hypothetical protein MZV63_66190 [Marinilabiliales bacterium]|nr:hypothetical protein [Marinilabiliales bacterium]
MLAKEHGIPFYVAAPTSTIDLSIADGGGHPHRGAAVQTRSRQVGGRLMTIAPRRRGPQPRLRRHPGRLHHGHRHRARHPSPALREELEDRRRIAEGDHFEVQQDGSVWSRQKPVSETIILTFILLYISIYIA